MDLCQNNWLKCLTLLIIQLKEQIILKIIECDQFIIIYVIILEMIVHSFVSRPINEKNAYKYIPSSYI